MSTSPADRLLRRAVLKNDETGVRSALVAGANPTQVDAHAKLLLTRAIENGWTDVALLLIAGGADREATSSPVFSTPSSLPKEAAWQTASRCHNLKVFRALMELDPHRMTTVNPHLPHPWSQVLVDDFPGAFFWLVKTCPDAPPLSWAEGRYVAHHAHRVLDNQAVGEAVLNVMEDPHDFLSAVARSASIYRSYLAPSFRYRQNVRLLNWCLAKGADFENTPPPPGRLGLETSLLVSNACRKNNDRSPLQNLCVWPKHRADSPLLAWLRRPLDGAIPVNLYLIRRALESCSEASFNLLWREQARAQKVPGTKAASLLSEAADKDDVMDRALMAVFDDENFPLETSVRFLKAVLKVTAHPSQDMPGQTTMLHEVIDTYANRIMAGSAAAANNAPAIALHVCQFLIEQGWDIHKEDWTRTSALRKAQQSLPELAAWWQQRSLNDSLPLPSVPDVVRKRL